MGNSHWEARGDRARHRHLRDVILESRDAGIVAIVRM